VLLHRTDVNMAMPSLWMIIRDDAYEQYCVTHEKMRRKTASAGKLDPCSSGSELSFNGESGLRTEHEVSMSLYASSLSPPRTLFFSNVLQ
jgi:hypothetical protein